MKSKATAALLAFFLGGFGAHFFYLGKRVQGVFCTLFCWTFVPAIIAIVDFIRFLIMTENDFNKKFNNIVTPVKANFQTVELGNTLDDLEKLYNLRECGAISEEEFETKKQQMLQVV